MEKTYLPDIHNHRPMELPPTESAVDILYRLIRESVHQKRNKFLMVRHPVLDQAAQQKANDMAEKNYYAHTSPTGVSANSNVRAAGYRLPDHYPVDGNNVESLCIGPNNPDIPGDPEKIVKAWLESIHHRAHVFGQDEFFRKQNCIGVAFSPQLKDKYYGYWVFLSCPCN